MIDFSKYAEDKDSYISKVEINEEFTKFKVIYASGREEEFDFSIHNYQVYLYRMEDQYHTYKKAFNRELNERYNNKIKETFFRILFDIGCIVLATNLDLGTLFNVIYITFIALHSMIVLNGVKLKKIELEREAMRAGMVELYLLHKEDFAVDVVDPQNHNVEKWYVVDINTLDNFHDPFELAMSAFPLQVPEIKEEYSKSMTEVLKKRIS